ncbi:MAG: phage tail protein [Liquorilactobacillus hordei]|uniref:phage tail protein n=1 Tax=Liquorilactobacillus hordei TaxID=468911 RepID=UPI0039E89E46
MELEDLEVLFKVNTAQIQPMLDKLQEAFSNVTGKIADTTKSGMQKTEDSMNISSGLKKVQEQIKQLNETVSTSFEKMSDTTKSDAAKISQNASKMFSGTKQKVSTDLQSIVSEINTKMQQARAAQAKMHDLMNQKNSLGTAQQSGTQGVKFDSQIATAQAQMTRYQNQAKALAQSMRGEFNAVPDSLNRISRAMDQNEVKIEAYRNNLTRLNAQLKDMKDTPATMQNDKWANSYAKIEKAVMSTQEKMNKLINSNDDLVKSYSYVQDRGESLSGIVGKLNTELSEDSSNARKAATSMNEMSSSMGRVSMNMNGMGNSGGVFSKIKNAVTGASNSMKMFGNNTSHSMDMSANSSRRMSGALEQIRMQISFLPSMIIVYGLLYNGITQLSQGFLSALKTNSQFSSSLNQIQVNLLTAFYPIYTAALPAINAMMSALAKVTSYIAQFTAALFGMSNSAAKSGASSLYSQVKAMNDTSSSSSAASKAVKEANKQITASNKAGRESVAQANAQITASNKAAAKSYEEQKKAAQELSESLMGFDELNVLDSNQANDLTKPDAQAKEKYTPQALQSNDSDADSGDKGLNFNTPTTQFAGLQDAVNNLKKLFGEIFDPMKEAWDAKGKEVTDAAKYAWDEVKRAIGDVGKSFLHVWDNGTGEKTMELLLQLLADMLNIIGDIAKAFSEAWEGGNRGTKLVQAVFDALNKVLGLIHDIATSFRDAFNDNGLGEKIFANILDIITDVFKVVGNLAGQFDKAWQHGNTGTSIFKTILGMVNDMLSALKDMADYTVTWSSKLDFTPLLSSIDGLLKAIRPVVKDVWDGLDWGYKNILLPLAKFTITELVPNFINDLAAAFKLVGSIINAAKPAFQWAWDSFLEPIAKWTGGVIIDVLKKLADALSGVSDWVDKHQKAVETMAKILITMFAFKVSMSGLSTGVGFLGQIADKAVILAGKGNVLKDFFGKITGLSDLKSAVTNVKNLAELSWTGIKSGAGYVVDLVAGIKNWSIWSKLAAVGQAALNLVMDANPIALIVIAIAAVVAGLVELYKHNKKFRDFCNGIWTAVTKWFGDTIKWLQKNWVDIAAFIINPVAGITTWFLKDTSVGKSIVKWASALPGKASDWAKGVGKKVDKNISDAQKTFEAAGKKIGDWVSDFKDDASKTISKWGSDLGQDVHDGVTGAKKGVAGAQKMAQEAGSKIGGWVSDFREGASKTISQWSSDLGQVARDGVGGAQGLAQETGKKVGGWVNDFRSGASTTLSSWAGTLGTEAHNGVQGARNMAQEAGSRLGSWVNDFRGGASNTISGWASGLGSVARDGMNGAKNLAQNAGSALGSWISDFRGGTASTLFDWAGGLGGRIADGIRKGFHHITSAMGDMANAIISPIKTAIGKIKDGINWVLDKVGAGGLSWGGFSWAKGTNGHPGGLAKVNDQQGPVYRESFELPNGKQGIFPDVRDLILPLPKGTKVKTATETAAKTQKAMSQFMPKYAGGIGSFNFDFSSLNALANIDWSNLFSGIGSGISDTWSGITDEFENILSDVAHPRKMLDYMVNKFMNYDSSWSDTQTKLAKGTVNTEEDGLMGWASKIMKQFGVGVQTGPGASGWASAVKKALAKLSLPTTDAYVNAWVKQIQTESGGNEKAMGGNDGLSDGNAEGLLQVKPGTFAANHIAGFNDIWKGYDNILAGINYAKNRYGSKMLSVIGHGHGYENGGMGNVEGLYPLFEHNKTEMVLPLTDKKRSLELIKQALSFMGETFSGGLQMPSALTATTDLTNISSTSNDSSNSKSSAGGINELGTTIVNALLQGLQMANATNSSNNNQTSDITVSINVDSAKLGQAAIKGINTVNAQNGKNMLNI